MEGKGVGGRWKSRGQTVFTCLMGLVIRFHHWARRLSMRSLAMRFFFLHCFFGVSFGLLFFFFSC